MKCLRLWKKYLKSKSLADLVTFPEEILNGKLHFFVQCTTCGDSFIPMKIFYFFFYLGFLSRTFTINRTTGEAENYLFNSYLPLPPASQTLRHQPGDYFWEFSSVRIALVKVNFLMNWNMRLLCLMSIKRRINVIKLTIGH